MSKFHTTGNGVIKFLNLTNKKFSLRVFANKIHTYTKKHIQRLIHCTFKYANITKKKFITISDIKYANPINFKIKYIELNRNVVKILSNKSNTIPLIHRTNYFNQYQFENLTEKPSFFFIIKNWSLVSYKNFFNSYKTRARLFCDVNKYFIHSKKMHIQSSNKKFTICRYILTKLENGNFLEKKFCFEILSKYKKINFFILYFIVYLTEKSVCTFNSFSSLKQTIDIIKGLLLNKRCVVKYHFGILFPILFKYEIEVFSQLKNKEIYFLKNYTSEVISIMYNRANIWNGRVYLKIALIFFYMIFDHGKCLENTQGSMVCISMLGLKVMELLLFPYLPNFIEHVELKFKKKAKSFKQTNTKSFYYTIMSILVFYCVKKNIKNVDEYEKIKDIFFALKKIKYK